ncbi:Uncharacterised protein [Shigella sonnei]|nr:Uncharacterised protein [Shigella sonnei]
MREQKRPLFGNLAIVAIEQFTQNTYLFFCRNVVINGRFTHCFTLSRTFLTRPGQCALHQNICAVTNPGNNAFFTCDGQLQRIQRHIYRSSKTGSTVDQRTIKIKSDAANIFKLIHDLPLPVHCAFHQ